MQNHDAKSTCLVNILPCSKGIAAINILTMEDGMFDCFGGKKIVVNNAFFLVLDSMDSCTGVWNFVCGLQCR
jgi:hypothetical protein